MGTTFNRKRQTPHRQYLRTHGTRAELVLWLNLKGSQMLGYKFRRQYGIDRYIVDFYCPELSLAIELDGASHASSEAQTLDRRRQAEIEQHGIQFLRFSDDEVLGDITQVLSAIEAEIRRITGE